MVLQQNANIKLWGIAKPNKLVYMKTSWSKETYKLTTKSDGNWVFYVKTPAAGFEKQWISINDGQVTALKNVLIGEVWFCSGQSNMEMPLKGFTEQPIENATETIQTADPESGIRMLKVKRNPQKEPVKQSEGRWLLSTPQNVESFSATAYFFALHLRSKLNIPIGIINSSWGGSSIEGWMEKSLLTKYKDVDLNKEIPDNESWKKPCVMFNGMVKPYTDFIIKGFLWYQGEANVSRSGTYASKLSELIQLWRTEWKLGSLPFYIVEIAPYNYGEDVNAAMLREAQHQISRVIENCETITINDLVRHDEINNIHPSKKPELGKRIAQSALVNTYKLDSICARFPFFVSHENIGNKLMVKFENCGEGLNCRPIVGADTAIVGFEIAGADSIFHSAQARLKEDRMSIELFAEKVPSPLAVRYCFRNFSLGNVKNDCGLPLIPFRSDNW